MTECRKTQVEMINPILSIEALGHLERCDACRARLCAEQSLTDALSGLPSYDAQPSPETEQALRAALAPQPAGDRRRWMAAAAAILIAGPLVWFALRSQNEPPPALAPPQRLVQMTPFLVLDPISPDLAAGRGRLIRARLPAGAAVAYGLQIPDTDGSIEADVLLGDDGAVYAVRFVY